MNLQTKNVISIFLGLLSSAGVIGTAYMAVKESKAAEKNKEELFDRNPNATKTDILLAQAKGYKFTIVLSAATISSIVASQILNKKAEMSILAAATLAEQGLKKYEYQIKKTLGLDTHKTILENISKKDVDDIDCKNLDLDDGKKLYRTEHIGFFKCKPENLAMAYADMNQRLHTVDHRNHTAYFCILYNMLKDADAEILDKNISNSNISWGWTKEYLEDTTGVAWVHMHLGKELTSPDGTKKYRIVSFDEEPVEDASNGGGEYLGYENDKETYKEVKNNESIEHN